VFGSIAFVPAMPSAKAARTKTSQPKVAVFQWSALHRPMRAATFWGVLPGISCLLGVGNLMGTTLGGRRRRDIVARPEWRWHLTPIRATT
jgi:hypothetical protein